MRKLFQVFVVVLLSVLNFASHATSSVCHRSTWVKKGCRKDYAREMVLLFSDRDPASDVRINWNHWQPYLVRYPLDLECSCVGETFKPCKDEDPKSLCVGRAFRAYFYEFNDQQNKSSCQIPAGGYGCQKAVDVALVIDTSGSVKQVNFNKVIQFLKMFVDRFDFPDSGTRFSLMRFDHRVCIDLMLEDSVLYSLHELKNKISKMRYTGGSTDTQLALKEVKEKIYKGAPRDGVPRTCIIMTDGKTYGESQTVIQPAKELRALGVHMIAIGVGSDVDTRELSYIAGKHVILLTSFDEVLTKAHLIIDQLARGTCGNV